MGDYGPKRQDLGPRPRLPGKWRAMAGRRGAFYANYPKSYPQQRIYDSAENALARPIPASKYAGHPDI